MHWINDTQLDEFTWSLAYFLLFLGMSYAGEKQIES